MIGIIDVKIWGTTIGKLGYGEGQTEFATFEFLPEMLNIAQSLSPLKVPNTTALHTFSNISTKTFHGLPGFIADSLPDKFGSQLIDQYFASKGIESEAITALDRLLYVGNRSIGALEYEPATILSNKTTNIQLDLQNLFELSEMVVNNKKDFAQKLNDADREQAITLLRVGSSAGGARSKALVAIDNDGKLYDGTLLQSKDCKYYLLKFDSNSNSDRDKKDPKGITRVEYVYSLIAKKCQIEIPNTSYIEIGDDFHFLIERFDRIKKENGKLDKVHYVSWCGIEHYHRDETGAFSYEQLILTARRLGLKQGEITQLFRRAIFNIVGRNQDDHTKNFGFLMDRDGKWKLSPAFDMTYSYDPTGKWTKGHQITLGGKQDGFTKEDIVTFGQYCNITQKKALEILTTTKENFKSFKALANQYTISDAIVNTVWENLRFEI